MRDLSGRVLLSASDLMQFSGCHQAIAYDLQLLRDGGEPPAGDDAEARILQAKGLAHEKAYLTKLKESGRPVVEIRRGSLQDCASATQAALADGVDYVFQGALYQGLWGGWADFLERVDRPSALGTFSYEVADTKLKREVTPKHVLQLVVYSDLLAQVQGRAPEFAHIELGTGKRATIRLADYAAYARRTQRRLEAFVADPWPTRPIPCSDCGLCGWADRCQETWDTEDSLFNVANIARGQVMKLEAAGVRTMAELASLDHRIRGMADSTREKLTAQARLQHARKTGEPSHELREPDPGRGFDLLPEPNEGDVFYDIEGDPHYDGGLEYLHGLWFDGAFQSIWAHDHDEEKRALVKLLAFFEARLTAYPDAHIYHYAPYEVTALRRLTAQYGVGEAFLDRLMREKRFVDLYGVVRGAVICSEPNYSIKSLEVFYGLKREGDVKTAGGSVVAYEEWRETREQAILDDIENYNRIDCVSTELLRNWLLSFRPEGEWPILGQDGADKQEQQEAGVTELRDLIAEVEDPAGCQDLLFNLARFHNREAKPAWWAVFDSLSKDEEDLIDDLDCLAGLQALGPATPIRQSMERRYSYPPQETKIRAGKDAHISAAGNLEKVKVENLDRESRVITLSVGKKRADLLEDHLTVHPPGPVGTEPIEKAIKGMLGDLAAGTASRAAIDLLTRNPPRLGLAPGAPIIGGQDLVEGTIAAVTRMQETVLPIQGPPGTGKTYVTARAILALLASDPNIRIGVSGPNHEAIKNLLLGCCDAMDAAKPAARFGAIHMGCEKETLYPDEDRLQAAPRNQDAIPASCRIVGGTTWFFSREEHKGAFDWLFVDEAGQVGLANAFAMTQATRNVVLVGDPRQLPQVVQGSHPSPAGLSCLEWMLGDEATIPPHRGIFLSVSRRMHPAVCGFISDQVYEGRLESHPDTAQHRVHGTSLPTTGAHWVPVEHTGRAQICDEEIAEIRATASAILKGRWTDRDGSTRPVTEADIIVVAPYNAQVNALRLALDAAGLSGVRAGTVDKFQGQEAAVCLVSMTASSAEDSPRGMEFLLSLNRINVAVSRAKALALVFSSPQLLEAKCETLRQMRLANTLCALAEGAHLDPAPEQLPWTGAAILGAPAAAAASAKQDDEPSSLPIAVGV